MNVQSMNLFIKNSPADLVSAMGKAELFLANNNCNASLQYNAQLVLEEIITNILKYVYEDDAEHTIDVSLRLDQQFLTMKITDDGRPFDPIQCPDPVHKESIEDCEVGGLGVYLIKRFAHSLHYSRSGLQNNITIRLNTESSL